MREYMVNLALKCVGCPYIWGGANPWTGFDCSGFVVWVFQVFGLLPSGDWTAQGLYDRLGRERVIARLEIAPGDLVFYGRAENEITHVMMAVANRLVVGASGGGREMRTVEQARARGAMVKVKRIDYRQDLVAAVRVLGQGE